MSKINQMKRDVDKDISDIKKVLNNKDFNALLEVHQYMDSKYQSKIKTWGYSQYGWSDKLGFDYTFMGTEALIDNLKNMIGKLEGYKRDIELDVYKIMNGSSSRNINVYNTNTNTNTNNNINNNKVDFSALEKHIINNETMTDEQTKEALLYLKELQTIFESKESRKNKWEKAKKIVGWLLDKGVDVAISYLPAIVSMISK